MKLYCVVTGILFRAVARIKQYNKQHTKKEPSSNDVLVAMDASWFLTSTLH